MPAFKAMRMSGPSPAFKRQKTSHTDHAKLARLQRQVAALKPEVKLFELITDTGIVSTSGSVVPLTLLAQGTNAENRIGDACSGVSIEMKIGAKTSSATNIGAQISYSFLLVKDLESNGVVPAVSGAQGIFVSNIPTGGIQQAETAKRFKVLAQRTYTLTEILLSRNVWIQWNIKLNNKMTFHDNTSNQTTAGKNSLYLVTLTDDTAGASNASFRVGSVLRFTDA